MTELVGKRIWVAGHRGLVGAALCRRLAIEDCTLLTAAREELDLTRQADVEAWMEAQRPELIFIAAARVGGIQANLDAPGAALYENLAIASNILHSAYRRGVEKALFIASAAVYPLNAPQPYSVASLLQGPPDPTHDGYATAKLAGIALCRTYRQQYGCDFISALPTNLYGPDTMEDARHAHVVPSLLRRFHEARETGAEAITLWGTGKPLRDFLHADDLADALVFLMRHHSDATPVNLGAGEEISIRELARVIAEVTNCRARLVFDETKPDGAARRLMDLTPLREMGWNGARPLREGLTHTYTDWLQRLTSKEYQNA